MKNLLLLFCCGLCGLMLSFSTYATEAEKSPEKPKAVSTGDKVYTWIDKYGNRIYSDEPREGAEVMKINKGSEYTPPSTDTPTASDWNKMKPKVISTGDFYSHFKIASPGNDTTVRNNAGSFQVALDIRPKLAKNHRVKLKIDGKEVSGSGQIITLNNIDRGTHTLVAYILSADNSIMATTPSVSVHVHRAIKKRGG